MSNAQLLDELKKTDREDAEHNALETEVFRRMDAWKKYRNSKESDTPQSQKTRTG
jgi:hypothetical protein